MKKLSLIIATLLLSMPIFASCNDNDDQTINYNDTPTGVKEFITSHFANAGVRYVEKDWDSYDVHLKNGFEIDFNLQGKWTEVDANRADMPQSIIDLLPAKIMEYLNGNYTNRRIESISNRTYGYKIELTGNPDVEIIFDNEGNFQRFDD